MKGKAMQAKEKTKIFKIPVYWTMTAIMEIEADDLDQAIQKAQDAPLPDGSYVSDSFQTAADEMEHKEGEPA